MAGFKGFTVVEETLRREARQEMVNLAVSADRIERLATHEYLHGTDLVTGRQVRAVLSNFRSWQGRATLAERFSEAEGGAIVLTSCTRNRNGTWEASGASAFPAGSPLLTDGMMRVGPAVQRDGGSWSQSIQHLRTGRAAACRTYAAIVDAVYAALSEEGPGRSGAVVRGWHPGRDGAMGFEIGLVFDPDARCYLDADASFSAFLVSPDIWVGGLGVSASGERCMEIVGQLIDQHPDDIVWEVIPKRTYSLGGFIAETAGTGTGRDVSSPYRMGGTARGTGCVASIIGFVERNGILWPRTVVPQRHDAVAVHEIRVPTARVRPSPPPPRSAASFVPSRPAPSPARPAAARFTGEADAPAPLPPDMVLPRVAAAGNDAPDLGAPGNAGAQDDAALASPDTPDRTPVSPRMG